MTKRSKLSMQVAYDSDSSAPSTDQEPEDPSEYDPSSHRRKRQKRSSKSKESAALGVFGSESEDEYEDYSRSGKGKKGFRNLREGGMSFVKTGEQTTKSDEDDEDDDDEDEESEGLKEDPYAIETTAGLRDIGTGRGNEGYSSSEDEKMEEDKPPILPRSVNTGISTPNLHRGPGFQSAMTSHEASPAPDVKPLFSRKGGLGMAAFKRAGVVDSSDLEHPGDQMDHTASASKVSLSNPLGTGFVSSIRKDAMFFQASQELSETLEKEEEEEEEVKQKPRPSFTDLRGIRSKKKKTAEDGAPAVNQDSFAARMMAKMGYKPGQGLGKTGEGRLAPVDTKLRPTRAGLGVVKEKTEQAKIEERRVKMRNGEAISDSDSEKERKRRKKKKQMGSKEGSGASTPARRKAQFRTAEEMARELDGVEVPSALKNLIDLTGKGVDVGSPGLLSAPEAETEAVKIAKAARKELEEFAREWKRLQERKKFLKAEEAQMTEDVDEQAETVKALQGIVGMVETLDINIEVKGDGRNGFEDKIAGLAAQLETLQFTYKNEVELYELSEVALAAFHPLFKSALVHWDPLTDPVYLLDHIRKLRHIFSIRTLEDMEASLATTGYAEKSGKKSTYYESMMHDLWLPKIRSTINNSWDVHDPTPILTILETWSSVLPPFISANILNQLVLPKLKSAVSEWNPRPSHRRKPVPAVHVWVFPWLPHLSAHMDDLVREVKRKFKVILDKWDLYKGVVDGLDAWREVFGPGELEKMLISHLLPRLADLLRRKFEVNPADQDVRPIEAVMGWHVFFRQSTFAQLLEAEFFPKWMQTLYQWLTMDGVDLEEVGEWYKWWQAQFPEEVREYVLVRREFKKAVEMMGQAVDGEVIPPESGAARPIKPEKEKKKGTTAATAQVGNGGKGQTETTFREYMEEWCAEQGLLLMPLRKAHEGTGHPLFRITDSPSGSGGVLCYFSQDVVWAQDRKRKEVFEPVGLEVVVQRVEAAHK